MSITGRVRTYGRLHGALGAFGVVFLALFVAGFAVGFDEALSAVNQYGGSWVDVFTYAGTAAFLIALIAAFVVGSIWYSLTTERQCDEWDATTVDLDGRYYLDEYGNAIPGSLTHYDYLQGLVWEEWFDANGLYHCPTIRKLTRAELQENEVLTKWGGTGGIKYHE